MFYLKSLYTYRTRHFTNVKPGPGLEQLCDVIKPINGIPTLPLLIYAIVSQVA